MPKYESISDLPSTITDILPDEALELYLKGYKSGWDMYDEERRNLSRNSVAHRQGWQAVQEEYDQDPDSGDWVRKGEMVEEEGEKGLVDKVKDLL